MSHTDDIYFLLVDDREENLLSLEALLRSDGVKLLKAKSGPEALELLLKYDVALALLDVQMPEMDGYELAELMRGNSQTGAVPIIFLTAGAADSHRRFRGYQAGAVDFINKPIEGDILRSKAEVFRKLKEQSNQIARQRDALQRTSEENERLLEESRAQAEALKIADQRKDEFLATLAHELRNPLATISCGLEVLHASEDEEDMESVRNMMQRQLKHLVRLIEDLLDISRISQGRIQLRKEKTSLNKILESAVEASRPLIDRGDHTLSVSLPQSDIQVEADPTRLAQTVSNLLNNAAKYTPSGGKISLRSKQAEDSIVIDVEDNGIGIETEMMPRVFGLFEQVEPLAEHAQGGLGIGLALAKSLIALHGGEIYVRSEGKDKGSVFSIKLPFDNSKQNSEPTSTKSPENGRTSSREILIVDDNRDAAKTLNMMLKALGHTCHLAHSGQGALEVAKEVKPQVILLDIGLPDISGYEVCKELRKGDAFKDTIVIAQTGWGRPKDIELANEAGFDHHLVKPLELSALQPLL